MQENADDLRKKRYDQSHVKSNYAEGELVLLFVPQTQPGLARKLQCKWRGPFRIVQKTTSLNYVIRDLDTNKTQKVHVQRLRKYVPLPEHLLPTDNDDFFSSASSDKDSESERASGHAGAPRGVPEAVASSAIQSMVTRSGEWPSSWLSLSLSLSYLINILFLLLYPLLTSLMIICELRHSSVLLVFFLSTVSCNMWTCSCRRRRNVVAPVHRVVPLTLHFYSPATCSRC